MDRTTPPLDHPEGSLRDSERRYRDLLEGSRNLVFRLSEAGDISFLNRAFESLTGWPLPEWIGRPLADLVHADDAGTLRDCLAEVLRGHEPGAFDLRIRTAHHAARVLQVTLVPHFQDDLVVGAVGAGADVTEQRQQEDALRQAEAHYRHLVESMQAIVWRADAATLRLLFVSREAEALLGYPAQAWLEDPAFWQEHVHPDDREWITALRARAAVDKRDYEAEYRMIGASGRVLWLRDVVRVNEAELIGVMLDVTERRRAEDELRRSREQLSDLSAHLDWVREEERSGIAREIHDELGQSLTALRMDVAWLRIRLSEDEAGPSREALFGRLQAMCELIDETISRARRISSELRPGVLDDLGLEAAAEWQGQEFERRTGLRCQIVAELRGQRLEREVATALFRMLQEALTNVARHAQATSVRVHLREEAGRIVLEVADDGQGASSDDLAGRHSLGLLGMRERARRLGGTVTLSSAPGAGTTVEVSIPLVALAPPPAAYPSAPAAAVS